MGADLPAAAVGSPLAIGDISAFITKVIPFTFFAVML